VAAEVTVNLRRILVLLVAVAALGTYLFVWELPQAEREAKKDKLFGVSQDAVTGISLTYPDREIELTKSDQGWRLVKPVDAAADETVVKTLITTLAGAEVQKTLDQMPTDLGPFGLDKPTVTVRLSVKDGTPPPSVSVGKNTAIGGKTYVRKGDEPKLYLTTTALSFGLNKQAKDLRNKDLLVFQDDDVKQVEIKAGDGATVTLTRKDKDAWTVGPGGHPADPTEARSYLSSLRSTRAADFPDDAPTDLKQYGLDAPRLTVTVTTDKGTKTLLLGAETTAGAQGTPQGTTKQIFAKRGDQPTVYAVGDWTFRSLAKSPAQFRDKTVLGFDPARVKTVALERKDGSGVTLTRGEQGTWQIAGGEAATAQTEAVTRLLEDLRELKGSDIAAEPAKALDAFGLDAPDLLITLTDKDGQPIGTLLAAKHDSKYYAMRAGTETVFEARDYMYTRLDKQRADFVQSAKPAAGGPAPTAVTPPGSDGGLGDSAPMDDGTPADDDDGDGDGDEE
jgi:Domain of unknown function (DUF4340)